MTELKELEVLLEKEKLLAVISWPGCRPWDLLSRFHRYWGYSAAYAEPPKKGGRLRLASHSGQRRRF